MSRIRLQNGYVGETGKKPRTWTGFWFEYELVDGLEKRRKKSKVLGTRASLTKRQAEEKLRTLLRSGALEKVPKTKPLPTDPPTRFVAASEIYLRLKSGDWGKKMRGVMASIFKNHINPVLGERRLEELKPSDIKLFFNEIAAKQSDSLTRKVVTHVRGVLDMSVEDGVLLRNPAKAQIVHVPQTRKPSGRFLELLECRALLEAASKRDYMILRIFLSCALRPSELFALRFDDLFVGRLRVDEAFVPCVGLKETKTDGSDGFVPLSPPLEAELRAYIRSEGITHPREFLFPSELGTAMNHDNYLDRTLKPIAKRAKVKSVNFQVLRRTVATHLQNHGEVKSAQSLLRHADAATTLKFYQKTLDANLVRTHTSWDAELISRDVVQ